MRNLLMCVSVLLLGLSWAGAQDSTSPASQGSTSQTSTSAGQTAGSSAGGQVTVEGCLAGSDGSFTLSDKHGMTYQLTGDTAKLSEHVGHEVKITGTSSSSGSESGSASSTGGSGQTLQVNSVKHVAKTCKSGGQMSH